MRLPAIGLAALMSYTIWKAGFAAVVPQYVISGLCVGLAILITNLMSWRVERR
ncbi:MAG: hypothetical protein IH616_09515 [Gemmatimonadales bacterium]|nr:hypothetical protein [Gemmatimonadales bacterium]